MKKRMVIILLLTFSFAMANAQVREVFGKWRTIDDETGQAKSIVQIYEKDEKAYGKVIEIINPEKQDAVCTQCSEDDPRKGQKILGMEVMKDMEREDDQWDNGTILDPNNGKVYSCKIWVENGKLQVRGYIGFSLIGRTQIWEPVD